MHRTTADYNTTVGGLANQHIDQSLPGTPGTRGSAEFFNAIQEEIVNIVEFAGLTLETSPSTDRTNGFLQLKTALFDSAALDTAALAAGAVTDAKVTSVSLSKLIAGTTSINVVDGGFTYDYELTRQQIKFNKEPTGSYPKEEGLLNEEAVSIFTETASGVSRYSLLDSSKLFILDGTNATYDVYQNEIDVDRMVINRNDASGNNDYVLSAIASSGFYNAASGTARDAEFCDLAFNGLSYQDSNLRIKHTVIDMGGSWSGGPTYNKKITTALATDAIVLSATFSVRRTSDGFRLPNRATYSTGDSTGIELSSNGSTLDVEVFTDFDPSSGYTARYCTIIYANA